MTGEMGKRGTQGREGVWLALELPLAGPTCPRPARPHPYPRRAPQRCYEGQHAALTWALGVPGLVLFAVRPAELPPLTESLSRALARCICCAAAAPAMHLRCTLAFNVRPGRLPGGVGLVAGLQRGRAGRAALHGVLGLPVRGARCSGVAEGQGRCGALDCVGRWDGLGAHIPRLHTCCTPPPPLHAPASSRAQECECGFAVAGGPGGPGSQEVATCLLCSAAWQRVGNVQCNMLALHIVP